MTGIDWSTTTTAIKENQSDHHINIKLTHWTIVRTAPLVLVLEGSNPKRLALSVSLVERRVEGNVFVQLKAKLAHQHLPHVKRGQLGQHVR